MKDLLIILFIAFSGLTIWAQTGSSGYGNFVIPTDTVVEVVEVYADDFIVVVDSLDYVDYSLYGIIKDRDWDCLVLDREQALSVLDHLPSDAYGLDERSMVKKLLTAKNLKLTNQELLNYKKVRSIQVSRLGIFSYPYFACRFKYKGGKLFFEKIAGSQRKSGYVYDNKPDSKVFLGGWSVNDDPQTSYDSPNSEPGMIYKIGSNKIIMLFLSEDERSFEIYELIK